MSYILIERQVPMSGAASPGMYTYDTVDEAKGRAKQKMGNAMLNSAVRSEGVMVITEEFATLYQDFWKRTIPTYTLTVMDSTGETIVYTLTAESGAKSIIMGADGLYDGEVLIHACAGVADAVGGTAYAQGATVWDSTAAKTVYEVAA